MQNTSPVFSHPAAAVDLVPFRRVKVTTTGVNYAGVADTNCVGTLLPGDPGGDLIAAVQDIKFGVHFATLGANAAIVAGDEVEAAANGKVIKKDANAAVGVALEAGAATDDVIRVKYY